MTPKEIEAAVEEFFRESFYDDWRGALAKHWRDAGMTKTLIVMTFCCACFHAHALTSKLIGANAGGTDTNFVNATAGGSMYVASKERISELPGRTAFTLVRENGTGNAVLRAVTAGKSFYATDMAITMVNSDIASLGRVVLRDGTMDKLPFVVGATAAIPGIVLHFNQPLQFSNSVTFVILSGTFNYSILMQGYEE